MKLFNVRLPDTILAQIDELFQKSSRDTYLTKSELVRVIMELGILELKSIDNWDQKKGDK